MSIKVFGEIEPVTTLGKGMDISHIFRGDKPITDELDVLSYTAAKLGLTVTDAVSLTATFAQGNEWVYAGDELDTLRQYLTVTATLPDETTVVVRDYALTGTLTEGTSTITALYGALSATFTVKVTGALPEGYTRFDYIEPIRQGYPTENKRILTKKYENLHDLSLNLLFGHTFGTSIGEAGALSSGFVLGGRASSDWTKEAFNVNVFTDGVKMTTHGRESGLSSASLPANTRHRLVYSNAAASPSSFRVDGGTAQTIAWGTTGAANVALAVAARQKEGESAVLSGGVQCGEFELTALDGTVVGHYIPCVRKDGSNFIIGLYETVDKLFYTAADTTATTIDNANCLYFVGNWAEAAGGADYTRFTRSLFAACPMGNMQAFDIAEGTLFVRRATTNGNMAVIDCATGVILADYACPTGHGNSVSFRKVNGVEKASAQDTFPLALVRGDWPEGITKPAEGTKMEDVDAAARYLIYELRVTRSACEIVRTYSLSCKDAGFYAGLSVDEATKIGYTLGSDTYSVYAADSGSVLCKWDMTNLTENEDGTFTPALIASIEGPHIDVLQGQQLHDGLLWVTDGAMNTNAKVYAIDLTTGAKRYFINTGVVKELESVAWLSEREMLVGYIGGIFEKFTFRKAE